MVWRRGIISRLIVTALMVFALCWCFSQFAPKVDKEIRNTLNQADTSLSELGFNGISLHDSYDSFITWCSDQINSVTDSFLVGIDGLFYTTDPFNYLGTDETATNIDVSSNLQIAYVVSVIDGDTLKVSTTDGVCTVRLIGIDAPESVSSDESKNCAEGELASDYMKKLVKAEQVIWLQKDVSNVDKYNRKLRYVWLEKPSNSTDYVEAEMKMLNAILVRQGYAQPKNYAPDTAFSDLFSSLGEAAAKDGLGVSYIWNQERKD